MQAMEGDDKPIIDTVYTMTQRELWQASVLGTLRRLWGLLVMASIVLPFLLFSLHEPSITIPFMAVYLLLLAALILGRPWYSLSGPKVKALLERETRIFIDRNSVKIYVDDELRGTLKLDEMLKAVRVGRFWLLSSTRTLNYAIPRKIFSPEQEAEFADALRSHHLLK